MAFERLLRLTKKCPGYVVSGLRNASVGIATVTQKSFESQNYVIRALFGTRSLFAMTVPTPPAQRKCQDRFYPSTLPMNRTFKKAWNRAQNSNKHKNPGNGLTENHAIGIGVDTDSQCR